MREITIDLLNKVIIFHLKYEKHLMNAFISLSSFLQFNCSKSRNKFYNFF